MSNKNEYIEIISDKLYFLCSIDDFKPPHTPDIYFSTDSTIVYTAFFADFGPFNLGSIYQFCEILDNYMKTSNDNKVIYYCSNHQHRRANSATLICAYLVIVCSYTVEQAYKPFIGLEPPFIPFRDAAFSINTFPITVLDCTRALFRAIHNQHFSYETFSLSSYVNLLKLENGDISWIIPNKFIAFSGPISKRRELRNGLYTLLPEEYIPIFKDLGVTCIIRFNNKCYDKNIYIRAGIRHVDLFYEDGGNPTDAILQSFIQICERETGAIAVHCKAGLGRTGKIY
jgi:cell division cycle 14